MSRRRLKFVSIKRCQKDDRSVRPPEQKDVDGAHSTRTMITNTLFAIVAVALLQECSCWSPLGSGKFHRLSEKIPSPPTEDKILQPLRRQADGDQVASNRRAFLASSLLATVYAIPIPASALDDKNALFRPNPLTNSILEQIRIWEQAEADNLKYGGELERGDAGNKGQVSAYPRLLMPILVYDQELRQVKALVHQTGDNVIEAWSQALSVLQQPSYQKVAFKKTFNKYGDNIYYSDPDRANLYLGGGATPKNEQSIAYLLRNDVLTNVEALQAELEYLLKQNDTSETTDLYQYADVAVNAMAEYLAIVPPNELAEARRILAAATTPNQPPQ